MDKLYPIKNYLELSPRYMMTEYGDVYDTEKGKIVEQITHKGYQVVKINHTYKLIHILVANTFIPTQHNCMFVKHRDGNKCNNHKDNLIWHNQCNYDDVKESQNS